jgi:hypothetical protein
VKSTTPKDNQKIEGKKKKKNKKGKGDKNVAKNYGEAKFKKRKVKFPCNLCTDDHLTHLCP